MKLSGRDAARFAAKPDLSLCGVLIYGEDGVEVAARRAKLVNVALGKEDGADMRLTRLAAAEVRRDPASVTDAVKARGFFAGRQVVVVEDAGDGTLPGLQTALAEATPDDAFLVVTAGILPARSKLRKLFEAAKNAAAAPCYGDAPDRGAISDMLREAGARDVSDDALRDLEALGRALDAGAMRDLITRLALYSIDGAGPVSPEDVAACAPRASDAELDEALDAVADGQAEALGPLLSRLEAQGQSATGLVIAASRYFRQLHAVAAVVEGGGAIDAAVGSLRPPVFGPRRDALMRRCRKWRLGAVETALSILLETDDALRGGAEAAGYAVLERAFLKLALTARRL